MTPSTPLATVYLAKMDEGLFRQLLEDHEINPSHMLARASQHLRFSFTDTLPPPPPDLPNKEFEEEAYYVNKITNYTPAFYASRYFITTGTTPNPLEKTFHFLLKLNYSERKCITLLFTVPQTDFINWESDNESAKILKEFSNSLML